MAAGGHVEDNSFDPLFSVHQGFPGNLKRLQLSKMLFYIRFYEDPLFTQCLNESVKIRMRPADYGLKSPMPGLQLVSGPCPSFQNLPINRPHFRAPLWWNDNTIGVGVAPDKIFTEVVENWHGSRVPLLQVLLKHVPDRENQTDWEIRSGINFFQIHVEVFIRKSEFSKNILIDLIM